MRAETVSKTLHYKRAAYLQSEGNLQEDFKKAIAKVKTVGTRKQVVNAAENTFLLLNSIRNRWGITFGSLLLYSRGRNQPLVTEDDAADELKVEQLAPPPDSSGARRDFVESLLFFGMKENHVVVLQSSGLRTRQFESHLNWLLQTNTATISEEDRVELSDQPSKSAIREVLKSPVKSVTIGVPLETRAAGPRKTAQHLSFRPQGVGFSVLKSILGAEWLNKLKLIDSLDESRLRVEVHVSYTRSTDDSAQEFLNDIAVQLRHQEPEDIQIQLQGGAKLSGEELKLSGSVSVLTYGGLVDLEDLFPRMRDWLKEQLELGIVDA
jgi:hypothetical protein